MTVRERPESKNAATNARPARRPAEGGGRGFRLGTAFLVFLGTLTGSLIGAAGDLGDAVDNLGRLAENFYPRLCVTGSNTILGDGLGLAEQLEQGFESGRQVRVVVDAPGSTAGVDRAIEGGCVDVLAMSEPMPQADFRRLTEAGVEVICAAEIGYDMLVFITDPNNPIPDVQISTLRGMLTGRIKNWREVRTTFDAPVTLLARPGSGTTDFGFSSIGGVNTQGARSFPPDARTLQCISNDECLDKTLSINGALYWASVSWARTQPPAYIRVLGVVDGDDARAINPLYEQIDIAQYPLQMLKPIYMYVLHKPGTSPEQLAFAKDFLTYVRGTRGQQAVEGVGFLNHFKRPAGISVPLPPGFGPVGAPDRVICKAS